MFIHRIAALGRDTERFSFNHSIPNKTNLGGLFSAVSEGKSKLDISAST